MGLGFLVAIALIILMVVVVTAFAVSFAVVAWPIAVWPRRWLAYAPLLAFLLYLAHTRGVLTFLG